jgi:hypothetical protein
MNRKRQIRATPISYDLAVFQPSADSAQSTRSLNFAPGSRLEGKLPLIPANAGIQLKRIDFTCSYYWVPAFAGTNGFRQTSRQITLCVWVTMAFIRSFAFPDFLDSLVSLFAAFVLGTLIGAERSREQRHH